jgi:hypothetical protein
MLSPKGQFFCFLFISLKSLPEVEVNESSLGKGHTLLEYYCKSCYTRLNARILEKTDYYYEKREESYFAREYNHFFKY